MEEVSEKRVKGVACSLIWERCYTVYLLPGSNTSASSGARDTVSVSCWIPETTRSPSLFPVAETYGLFVPILNIEKCRKIYSLDHRAVWFFFFQFIFHKAKRGWSFYFCLLWSQIAGTRIGIFSKQWMQVCILCNQAFFPSTFNRAVTVLLMPRRLRTDCVHTSFMISCSQGLWIESQLLN